MSWDFEKDLLAVRDEPLQFDPENPKEGIYFDVPNEVYHSCKKAISNSMLSAIHESVSNYKRNLTAPVNEDKLKTFEIGTAVHAIVLEPERFEKEYAVAPNFNLRTTKGKENLQLWQEANAGKYQISNRDYEQICYMRDSILADPRMSLWLSMDGKAEAVIIVRDPETGLLLKIRTDWLVETDDVIVCLDLKTTETIAKFRKDFFNLRYDVQDAFYTNVMTLHFNKPVLFLFGVVSKSVEVGRYPVAVENMADIDRVIASEIYRKDLNKIAEAIKNNDWIEYTEIKRSDKQREYYYEQLK